MKTVYLSGPYNGNIINVSMAIDIYEKIQTDVPNVIVFIPHLLHYVNVFYHHTELYWLDVDLKWVSVCDCVFRMPGISDGADKEVKMAEAFGKPVFRDVDSLYDWAVKK